MAKNNSINNAANALTADTLTFNNTATGGLVGTTTNDNAPSGIVGEYVFNSLASGSAISLSNGIAASIVNISLTAGDWDVSTLLQLTPASSTAILYFIGGSSSTNNTLGTYYTQTPLGNLVTGSVQIFSPGAMQRFSLSTTTTIYLVAQAGFSVSALSAFGTISARRAR